MEVAPRLLKGLEGWYYIVQCLGTDNCKCMSPTAEEDIDELDYQLFYLFT